MTFDDVSGHSYTLPGTTKQSPEESGRVRRLNISLYVY